MKKIFMLICVYICMYMSACSSKKEDRKTEPEKFPVISPVLSDTLYNSEYVAEIQSIRNVEIRAKVKGFLEKSFVDEGNYVKQGQLLFSIGNPEFKQQILTAKAMLKNAVAEAGSAESDLENVRILSEKKIVAQSELSMAKSRLEALKAKIEEAESNVVAAQFNLTFSQVRAPFDGIVDRIPNKMGSLVDEGMLLTTISDNKEVFAYFNVSEKDYLDFLEEKNDPTKGKVSLLLANNKPFSQKGIVETISGVFDRETGSIAFRARFANPDRILKHGSSGKVLLANNLKDALIIPQKSTFEVQDKLYVYVLDAQNKVSLRSITTQLRLPHIYVVASGLTESDRIVYEGIQNVKEGMIIIPQKPAVSPELASVQ